jgi:hypothetical protein
VRISAYFLFCCHIVLLRVLFLESAKLFTALGRHQQRALPMFMMNGSGRENETKMLCKNINMLLLSVPKTAVSTLT